MKKFLILSAVGVMLALSSGAYAANNYTLDQLAAMGTLYQAPGGYIVNGTMYYQTNNGTYTTENSDQMEDREWRKSADVHEGNKRDYRLSCPHLKKKDATVETCRQLYNP
jgi:hypothetical protein